jgi:hypothetical protein
MKIPMITPKKKELQRHQKVLGGFLLPGLLSVLLVFSLVFPLSYSKASDTETSSQLLNNKGFESNTNTSSPTNWTNVGDGYVCNSCGPAGGNALKTAKDGATVTSSGVNLLDTMTQDELNNGFDATYGSDVWLYSNNSSVPTCANASSGQDCKDTFSITLDIKDSSGTLLQQFEHRYENQSWTGWDRTTYDFTSTIPSNNWTSAIASLELYGIDEGFTGNGYGGPRFDNTHLSVTYTTQAVLDTIASAINQTLDLVNDQNETVTDIVQNFEVTVNDPIGNEIQSFSVEVTPSTDTNLTPEISIAPIEVPQVESMESEVEVASVETEMNDAQGDMSQQSTEEGGTDSQVESESGSESEEQAEGSSTVREKQQTKSQGNKSKSKSIKKAKRDAKQKVANKIVKNMGDKGRYDNTNQLRTLVVMGVLGNTRSFFSVQKLIPDTPNFFTSDRIPDSAIADNTGAAYYMIGGSDVAHRALVDSQYK